MLKFNQFVNLILNEGGNAIEDARPILQSEIDATYAYVIKNTLLIIIHTKFYECNYIFWNMFICISLIACGMAWSLP